MKLEESLKLERERTTAMLREPSPKGRRDVVIYVTDDRRSVQLDLHLSLRDKVDTIYTQCKEISAQRAFVWPKEDEYELWLTGRTQEPVKLIVKNASLKDQGIRAQDLLMATLKKDRPDHVSRAGPPTEPNILPIVPVGG